ncbi:barrier-to-autointegration factor-like [Schistocerca nitens]|uniref:barrier-to-autointegration factor-like n=1 Tax=Schistocerca nitens TaxID=7011 RepID=UPI002118FCAB|nr:barrier-to-autointegration factor-like [Schistocerca nitens]
MSSTSQKHRNFVAEPMGNKPVTELAGVGEAVGSRFQRLGYDKANSVLGQYLVLGRNKENFVGWMKTTAGANQKQANDCYRCLSEWSDQFL